MSDFTETNKKHWNNAAATYNTTFDRTSEILIAELQARLDWIGANWTTDDSSSSSQDEDNSAGTTPRGSGSTTRLLDYACGPGMVSRALSPSITAATGIDIAENMVAQYNSIASNQGLSPEEMRAFEGNLLDPNDVSPERFEGQEFFDFDVAAVGLGFHHFEDPLFAAVQLIKRLRKGGVLLLVDFVSHEPLVSGRAGGEAEGHDHAREHSHSHSDSHSHPQEKGANETQDGRTATEKYLWGSQGEIGSKEKAIAATVKHHGFSSAEMQAIFEQAGAGQDFGYSVLERDITFRTKTRTMTRRVFLCRGTKV